MNGLVVYKLSGSGNDFVFVDGRLSPAESWEPNAIKKICHRRMGIGADGFAVLEPGSREGRVRFHFFNSDGSRAPMCGNGSLCATRMARVLEFVSTPDMVLETDAGDVRTRALDGPEQKSEFKLPEIPELVAPNIDLAAGESSVFFATVAVPHVVLAVENVASVELDQRGRELRYHPAVGPLGSNVNFVSRSDNTWSMRTYERGVEAETLACGTGAVACAAVLCHLGLVQQLPWQVQTASGMVLEVNGRIQGGRLEQPSLIGESRLVYRAVLRD